MPYRNCLRCNLSILVGDYFLALRHCPRCLAREGDEVPMFETDTLDRNVLTVRAGIEAGRLRPGAHD